MLFDFGGGGGTWHELRWRADLDHVVDALAEASPALAEATLAAWVGGRAPDDAAAELLRFAGEGPTAAARLTAWAGLAHTGPSGEARAAGGAAGAMAAAWLVQHGELATDDTGEQEQRLILVENLAAMNDHGLLVEELDGRPVDEQLGLVSAVAGAQHPDRDAVLAAVGEEHPDPVVGEAARRASQRSSVSGMA